VLNISKKYLNMDISEFNLENTKELQDIIKLHSDLYYNKDEPIISDYEYDNLLKKLEYLEDKFKIQSKISNNI
jgi:DNA ligase (NAD+)